MIEEKIREALKEVCATLGIAAPEFVVEFPADRTHGDLASNVALVAARELKTSSRECGERFVEVAKLPPEVAKVTVEGPGFLNFTLAPAYFTQTLSRILSEKEVWGTNATLLGRKIIVEHTQPNPFKPFHIGHLMSNTLGESVARLVRAAGAEVRTANWQGDVGLHVAKALWGLRALGGSAEHIEDIGAAYVHGNAAYEDDEAAKKEIVELNKRLYNNDQELETVYMQGRKTSLDHFEELYKILGSHFDYYFFESEGAPLGSTLVEEGLEKGVFEESDGAVVFRGEKYGLHTRVFLTKEHLPTYEAKEFGLALLKEKAWPEFELTITTTAVEQKEYFAVVFKALSLLRHELAERLVHVSHGMMLLQGGKMSSRKGNVVTGEALLNDMVAMVYGKMIDRALSNDEKKHIANIVAVGAVKYAILRQSAGKNITFDEEKSLSLDGDSGPYLQYAYTRARSVLRKAEEAGVASHVGESATPTNVERILWQYPSVVLRALDEYEPHHITTYLTELAGVFNAWYATERILDTPDAPHRLAITEAFATTMKNGLWLLGIRTPERM